MFQMKTVLDASVIGLVLIQGFLLRGRDIEPAAVNRDGFAEQEKFMDVLHQSQSQIYNKAIQPTPKG